MQKRFEMEAASSTEYQNKENVNLRLSADISETIEDVLFYARKEMVRGKRKKITKSDLYETIFRDLISEYQTRGKESRLWKLVMTCGEG